MKYEEFIQMIDQLMVKYNKWFETSESKSLEELFKDVQEWENESARIWKIENTDDPEHISAFTAQTICRLEAETTCKLITRRCLNAAIDKLLEVKKSQTKKPVKEKKTKTTRRTNKKKTDPYLIH